MILVIVEAETASAWPPFNLKVFGMFPLVTYDSPL